VPGPLLGTGLLGGYTTFSTFAVETVRLAQAGRAGLAVASVVGSVVGALLAALAGLLLGRALSRLSRPRQFRRRVHHARTLEQARDRR
jgi:CrcB protein